MGQIKWQNPLFDKMFLTKLLFIAQLDPFEIMLDNLMNFDNCTILIYDIFDDCGRGIEFEFFKYPAFLEFFWPFKNRKNANFVYSHLKTNNFIMLLDHL